MVLNMTISTRAPRERGWQAKKLIRKSKERKIGTNGDESKQLEGQWNPFAQKWEMIPLKQSILVSNQVTHVFMAVSFLGRLVTFSIY